MTNLTSDFSPAQDLNANNWGHEVCLAGLILLGLDKKMGAHFFGQKEVGKNWVDLI